MSGNTLGFLLSVIKFFKEADFPVWVFGGWAEELWHIAPRRIHNDIDFLYPATTFEHLDLFIAQTEGFQEIQAKRFSQKRAVVYQHVMIEFLLVQGEGEHYFTNFFSGRYRLAWPADVFCHRVNLSGYNFRVASIQALTDYRQHHEQVKQSYQDFLTTC
jgi:hypothetical protein